MDLVTRIMEFLVAQPTSKAREIANALNADKTEVNRVLYAGREHFFEVNAEYQWSALNGTSIPRAPLSTTAQVNFTPGPSGPDPEARRRARAMLARLKRGVPPDGHVADLAVRMDHLQLILHELLLGQEKVRWTGVTGEYGEGKTFFRMMAYGQALEAGYAVASFDVNRDDGALHQPQRHMALFLNTLRSPLPSLNGHQGIVDLFRQWISVTPKAEVVPVLKHLDRIVPPITNVHDSGEFSRLAMMALATAGAATQDISHSPPLLRMATFLSCADLVWRSTQARFSAVYRLRLIIEWLKATGHKGLLLFIDELDNVVRQIHGKAHPACFRSLAWYCTAPRLDSLRVIVAMTPEMVDRVSSSWLDSYGDCLDSQQTVRPEECSTYWAWSREVAAVADNGWPHCPTLNAADRVELFQRIAAFHEVAWGNQFPSIDVLIQSLAKSHSFRNTRRWVRASVSILDLMHQHPEYLLDNGPAPAP
jgi:RecA/RadA recombinase